MTPNDVIAARNKIIEIAKGRSNLPFDDWMVCVGIISDVKTRLGKDSLVFSYFLLILPSAAMYYSPYVEKNCLS